MIEVRDTEPGQLFRPLAHLVLADEPQALCGTRVSDGPAERPLHERCVVCSDLGLKYLDWHYTDVTF